MKHACILAAAWTGLAVSAAAQPGVLKLIVPGVWFRQGDMQFGHSNNAVIEMRDYLVVVDANYPSGAEALIGDIRKVSSKPIRYVINTHHHPDHAYGNYLFTRLGATTIAYVGTYEEMHRYEPAMWQQVMKERKDVRESGQKGMEAPQLLYTTSPYVINDGARRVELYHFGPGHTRGDTFVYLPKERVICTGDAVVNGAHADPKQAFMAAWPIEIRAAQKLDVEYVFPGHGAYGGKELLAGEIEFFETLYKAVEAQIKEGVTLDQLVTFNKDGRPIGTTLKLPKRITDLYLYQGPNLALWQIARFPTQVRNTYEEIKRGKPWGVIAGGQ